MPTAHFVAHEPPQSTSASEPFLTLSLQLAAGAVAVGAGVVPVPVAVGAGAALGAAVSLLHAAIHVGDGACGASPLSDFVRDFPGVFLPALLTAWIAWRARPTVGV